MAKITSQQSAENMEFVRRLLEQKQPGFSAALELAAELVGQDLASPEMLPAIDPASTTWPRQPITGDDWPGALAS